MNREPIKLTAKIIASDTDALYEKANGRGIMMPHPALGIFTSVLAEIEKPNGNGVRLGKKATNEALSTLIGTQINRNHLRTGNVLGHIIDAEINKNSEIEITCIFFKDIYKAEWDEAQELFAENKLTMSFELSADIASQDKLADGTKRLNDYYFTGAGLLFGVKPACKKARVFEIATQKLQEKLNMERQSLIFANNQNSQKSIMEVLNLMADAVKKIEEVQAEEIVVETPVVETPVAEVVKTEEPSVMHVKAEEVVPVVETVVEPTVAEVVVTSDENVEEVKAEPVVEEATVEVPVVEEVAPVEPVAPVEALETDVVEPVEALTVVKVTNEVVKDTMEENQETIERVTETTVIVDDKVIEERVDISLVMYTYAQMEEVKAKYETEIASLKEQLLSKEKEVETLKAAKKEEEVVAEEKPILATGHKKFENVVADEGNALVNMLRAKRANRKN